jgi:hypothetical protein
MMNVAHSSATLRFGEVLERGVVGVDDAMFSGHWVVATHEAPLLVGSQNRVHRPLRGWMEG